MHSDKHSNKPVTDDFCQLTNIQNKQFFSLSDSEMGVSVMRSDFLYIFIVKNKTNYFILFCKIGLNNIEKSDSELFN